MKKLTLFLIIVAFSFSYGYSQTIVGSWEGELTIPSSNLQIQCSFKNSEKEYAGTISIPQQSAYNLKLKNINQLGAKISFDLQIPNSKITFDGILSKDSIKGTFMQSGYKGAFYLVKKNENLDNKEKTYNEEEIIFKNGDIKLAGTLVSPKSKGPFKCVVFLTGSGAQDRDERIFDFPIFKDIAEYLVKNNIASFRYDDRGVGGSDGSLSESTVEDFAKDAISAVNMLSERKEINAKEIGLLGHSEGGMASLIAANKSDRISFIVLMSSPVLPLDSIITLQLGKMLELKNTPQDSIKMVLAVQMEVMKYAKNGDFVKVKKLLLEKELEELKLMSEEKKKLGNLDTIAEKQVNVKMETLVSKWMQYHLKYDPINDLKTIKIPFIAFFGEKDFQVPKEENINAIEQIMKSNLNKNYKIIVVPKANHLYQESISGAFEEYSTLDKKLSEYFLKSLSEWLK